MGNVWPVGRKPHPNQFVEGASGIRIARGTPSWTGNRRADWKAASRFVNIVRLLTLEVYPSGAYMENAGRMGSVSEKPISYPSRTESWTGRVKRWRGAKMVLRWGVAALLVAEKGFRRVRGYNHLNQLLEALRSNQSELASMKEAA